jgi:Ankyrin repeat
MERLSDIVYQIELHSPDGIRQCFANGINPNEKYNGESLIYELTSEYTRSPRFKDCVKAFVEYGLALEDKPLLAVLLDDSTALTLHLKENPEIISKKYSLRCAYTPLHEVTLLHICAEFNHVACAEVLVSYGADINAVAGVDEYGFGGQTPIFHTVNQNSNQSADMLHFLLSKDAAIRITVPGIIWGKGYEWETLIPAVNPTNYAMMGLLPQMHRDEKTISNIVSLLLKHEFGIDYKSRNVPNKYLH